jgi:hypothetical protein
MQMPALGVSVTDAQTGILRHMVLALATFMSMVVIAQHGLATLRVENIAESNSAAQSGPEATSQARPGCRLYAARTRNNRVLSSPLAMLVVSGSPARLSL